MLTKKLKISTVIILALATGTLSFLYRDSLYESYLDLRFEKHTTYFEVNDDGIWTPNTEKSNSNFYRVFRKDDEGSVIGNVKIFYVENDSLYWVGKVKSIDPFLPEGQCFSYFKNGSLKENLNYRNGELNGKYYEFYKSGQIKYQGHFSNNLPDSICTSYNKNGTLKEQISFQNGLLDGAYKDYDINGNLIFSGSYKNNEPDGVQTTYSLNQKRSKVVTYKNGVLNGLYQEFDSLGNESYKGNYKNGLKHGVFSMKKKYSSVPDELFLNDTLVLNDANLTSLFADLNEREIKALANEISKGDSLLYHNHYEEAETIYSSILNKFPKLSLIRAKRGEIYFELAELKENLKYYEYAANDLAKSLTIETTRDYWYHYMYAMAQYQCGNFDLALSWLEITTFGTPEDANGKLLNAICYNQIAKIHVQNNNYREALDMYNKAIAIDTDRSDYYLGRAWVNYKMNDLEAAENDCRRSFSFRARTIEEKAESYSLMAQIKLRRNNYSLAEYWVSKSIETNPKDFNAIYLYSSLYPLITSDQVTSNFWSKTLIGISVALLFWEVRTVMSLISTGRFLGAAYQIAESVIVGSGIEFLMSNSNEAKNYTLKKGRKKQQYKISDLKNSSIIIHRNPKSIKSYVESERVSNFIARNYQSTTKYKNYYYTLTGVNSESYNIRQSYLHSSTPKKAFNKFTSHHNNHDKNSYINYLSFQNGNWQFITATHTRKDHRVHLIRDSKFPKDKILNAWSKKLKIMDIEYGNGDWVVALRDDCVTLNWFPYIKKQIVKVTYEFPEEIIKAYWDQDYFISQLKFADNKWILLMEKYKWNTNVKKQRVILENFFPVDRAYNHEKIGYNLQSITYGRGLWALVVTKKE